MKGKNQEAHSHADKHKDAVNGVLGKINDDDRIRDTILVMDQSFFLISSQLDEPDIQANRQHMEVTHFLLSRGMKTFWSVRCLIMAGCDQDAMALSRNLCETETTLEYLTTMTPTEELMDRFKQYEYIERTKSANRHRQAGAEPTVQHHLLREAEEKRVELVGGYTDQYLKGWAGKNIEGLFRDLNRSEYYNSSFSPGSLFTHPSFLARHRYRDNSSVHCSWVPSSRDSRFVGLIAVYSLLRLAQSYVNFHGVPGMESIIVEINWNILSRYHHEGSPINHPDLKKLDPVPIGEWGILP